MNERNSGQAPSDETTGRATRGTTGGATAQTTGGTTTPATTGGTTGQTNGDTRTLPYNLIVALVCVVAAVVAYLLTMLIFRGLITAPEHVAIVSGSLGVLFTFLGTVAGAYFGVKSTQDTSDKAAKQVEEAHKRESAALGALDPDDWTNLRNNRLL